MKNLTILKEWSRLSTNPVQYGNIIVKIIWQKMQNKLKKIIYIYWFCRIYYIWILKFIKIK
jgi:hypothetical protein